MTDHHEHDDDRRPGHDHKDHNGHNEPSQRRDHHATSMSCTMSLFGLVSALLT